MTDNTGGQFSDYAIRDHEADSILGTSASDRPYTSLQSRESSIVTCLSYTTREEMEIPEFQKPTEEWAEELSSRMSEKSIDIFVTTDISPTNAPDLINDTTPPPLAPEARDAEPEQTSGQTDTSGSWSWLGFIREIGA